MNEPVRVGLVFPRSGQQITVIVPRHLAASAESVHIVPHLSQNGRKHSTDSASDTREHTSRTQ